KRASKRHQAAAFRVQWPTVSHVLAQRGAHAVIRGYRVRVELGKPTTQVQAMKVQRQCRIVERRKRHDLSTSFGQEINRDLVVKTECAVLRDSDEHRIR